MNNRWFRYPGILIALGICICLLLGIFTPVTATAPSADDTNQTPHQATALVLMYVVGSDLESGNGHSEGDDGTSDLMDMISGYGETSPDNLNIVVAYGGAAKEGWKGMTIASIEDLKADAKNGVFGDEEIGEFHDPAMDMGSKEGLTTFLTDAREHYRGDTTYLIFWNHGDGYQGFGFDENTDNHLSISDITDVLEATGTRTDLIGFDACLMGGLEVAKSL
ncbi:MAG: clostripain-related cysteine peptidase, partial [Methanospirillum sp.]|uniref:clostripain-related cysteine peptidase n=1 Tax=Methanospirillum sp. TaxID=45200 RepID=UPI00236D12F8